MGLSFRVRNGTGRFPHAMTAVTLLPVPLGGREKCGYNIGGVVIQLSVPAATCPLKGFVGWEPHSGRKRILFSLYPPRGVNVF